MNFTKYQALWNYAKIFFEVPESIGRNHTYFLALNNLQSVDKPYKKTYQANV